MHKIVSSIVPHSIATQLQSVCVIGGTEMWCCMATLIPAINSFQYPTKQLILLPINTNRPQPTCPQIKQIHNASAPSHSMHTELSANSGVWTHRHTGHVESPHLIRQLAWNAWLHRIVNTPSTLSSIRSRQTGNWKNWICILDSKIELKIVTVPGHVGNSVWPSGGNPSWPHSTFDTQTAWHNESGSKLLYGVPLYVS